MQSLFSPLSLRSVTLKNRLAVSPMCQYSSTDGFANDWHLVHLGSRAVGGAGLIFTEAAAVSPQGRITPYDLGIYMEEHSHYLKRIADFIKKQDAVPGIQLAHAGRKASRKRPWEGGAPLLKDEGAWTPVAPSAVTFTDGDPVPKEMTKDEIKETIEDFKIAALRAVACGFDVVEIHAAHGYLIHEFLSPLTNHRQDEYGGTFENRTRFLLEIVTEIREIWTEEKPLFVRISATDWVDGGWTVEDSVRLACALKENHVDVIDCSSGGNSPLQKIPVEPLYQTPFAERIRMESGIKTGAVGFITTPEEAESIIAEGRADLVLMGRQMLRDPYFALHAGQQFDIDVHWPAQYERANPKRRH